MPENISPFFGWRNTQIGDIQPEGGDVRHVAFGDPEREGHVLPGFQDGVLGGANLVNCTQWAGRIRRAILQKWRCTRVAEMGKGPLSETVAEGILAACLESRRPLICPEAVSAFATGSAQR